MSRLREASLALARTGTHAVLPVERLFATERIAAGLETRRTGTPGLTSPTSPRARRSRPSTLRWAASARSPT